MTAPLFSADAQGCPHCGQILFAIMVRNGEIHTMQGPPIDDTGGRAVTTCPHCQRRVLLDALPGAIGEPPLYDIALIQPPDF